MRVTPLGFCQRIIANEKPLNLEKTTYSVLSVLFLSMVQMFNICFINFKDTKKVDDILASSLDFQSLIDQLSKVYQFGSQFPCLLGHPVIGLCLMILRSG